MSEVKKKHTSNQVNQRYHKNSCKELKLRFSKLSHPNLVSYIESQPNVTGFIADLIRKDMESKGLTPD